MNPKQQRFADAYLSCLNATEAARVAGYSHKTAHAIGWENLRKPEIADYISKRFQESAMSSDENLMHIAEIARGGYGPGFFLTETLETVENKDGEGVIVKRAIGVDWDKVKEYGRLIKSLTFTNFGPKIELHDRLAALLNIGKQHGLFSDQHVVTVKLEKELDAILDIAKQVLSPDAYNSLLAGIGGETDSAAAAE